MTDKVQNAKEVCKILKDNYLSIWNIRVYKKTVNIAEKQAIKVSFNIHKEDSQYIQECFLEVFKYWLGGFKTIIVNNVNNTMPQSIRVTCLLIY